MYVSIETVVVSGGTSKVEWRIMPRNALHVMFVSITIAGTANTCLKIGLTGERAMIAARREKTIVVLKKSHVSLELGNEMRIIHVVNLSLLEDVARRARKAVPLDERHKPGIPCRRCLRGQLDGN